jgi:hypothetical protein
VVATHVFTQKRRELSLYGRKLNEKDKGHSLKEKTTSGPRARASLVLFMLAQRAPNRAWAGPAGHRCSTLPDQAHTALAYAAWPSKQSDAGRFARSQNNKDARPLALSHRREGPTGSSPSSRSPSRCLARRGKREGTRTRPWRERDSLCPCLAVRAKPPSRLRTLATRTLATEPKNMGST